MLNQIQLVARSLASSTKAQGTSPHFHRHRHHRRTDTAGWLYSAFSTSMDEMFRPRNDDVLGAVADLDVAIGMCTASPRPEPAVTECLRSGLGCLRYPSYDLPRNATSPWVSPSQGTGCGVGIEHQHILLQFIGHALSGLSAWLLLVASVDQVARSAQPLPGHRLQSALDMGNGDPHLFHRLNRLGGGGAASRHHANRLRERLPLSVTRTGDHRHNDRRAAEMRHACCAKAS
ncbi:MAG: hypothetical protein CM15mP74_28030 [Halieaceae bacterium]|nr:MAG: hypothetical protein CM15mP74_28030 [Halieaceae bacterium]